MIKNYLKTILSLIILVLFVSGCTTTGKKGSKGFKHDTPLIKTDVKKMISEFGKDNYIVNLGHGILPNVPVKNAKVFINAIKNYSV